MAEEQARDLRERINRVAAREAERQQINLENVAAAVDDLTDTQDTDADTMSPAQRDYDSGKPGAFTR